MHFHNAKDTERNPGRVAIAKYLDESGPTAGDALAVAVGMTPERFWVAINHPWFEITGKGWGLTDRGRSEGLTDK